jgi:hypothetical protein
MLPVCEAHGLGDLSCIGLDDARVATFGKYDPLSVTFGGSPPQTMTASVMVLFEIHYPNSLAIWELNVVRIHSMVLLADRGDGA